MTQAEFSELWEGKTTQEATAKALEICETMNEEERQELWDSLVLFYKDQEIEEATYCDIEVIKRALDKKLIRGIRIGEEVIEWGEKLRRLFDLFNTEIYNGELPETNVFINLQFAGEIAGTYDYGPNYMYPELTSLHNIDIQIVTVLENDEEEIMEVLLHEMAHEYCRIKNGTRVMEHGIEFRDICNSHGLIASLEGGEYRNTTLNISEELKEKARRV